MVLLGYMTLIGVGITLVALCTGGVADLARNKTTAQDRWLDLEA